MANIATAGQVTSTVRRVFTYDFAKDGGAVGTLNTPIWLPDNVFCELYVDTINDITSGGLATIDIQSNGSSLFPTPGPIGFADFGGAGVGGQAFVLGGTDFHKTRVISKAGQVALVIGTAALTGGKFVVTIAYDVVQFDS